MGWVSLEAGGSVGPTTSLGGHATLYIEWMGETYLREHMQLIVQLASPRLYHTLWGENDALWGEHVAKDKKEAPDLKENPV